MVTIKPFKSMILNPELTHRDELLCPVYDTIDETEYARYGNEKNNVIHITSRRDGIRTNEFIGSAKKSLDRFIKEKILVEREHPAFYIYGIKYNLPENMLGEMPDIDQRNVYFAFGLVALTKVEEPGEGDIVGHERIFKKHTVERYDLMKALGMNFSPIVAEYNMPGHDINNMLEDYLGFRRPDLILRDDRPPLADLTLNGIRHLLWEITDPDIIQNIRKLMSDKRVMILDGHHRYTATRELNIADNVEYTMMMFMEGGDRALLLLPWHRCVRQVDVTGLRSQVREHFDTIWKGELNAEFYDMLQAKEDDYDVRIGLYDGNEFCILKAHKDEVAGLSARLGEKVGLDNISLNEWIIGPCAGDNNANQVVFVGSTAEAIRKVDKHGFNAAFLMRPLTIEDVEYKAHVEMKNFPQKSTLFLPKVAEGIMMRRF
ncbi:MAG TPA: DUF1015 family protein [Methanosarcinaceae archaeon]|nr:DUF1015 family protein [Methanosarcinaceae archaeon]